ncbi:hypothetical protein LCGC14_1055290, partial [marine sediment metagenome]
MDELTGYKRADGSIGFRNHLLVMPLSGCQMTIAQRIADAVDGATVFAHPHGCDFQAGDFDLFAHTLERFALHANVGGVLFLAMGCAQGLTLHLPSKVRKSGRSVETINTQQAGTGELVSEGTRIAGGMVAQFERQERV